MEAIVSRVVRTGLERARSAGWQGVFVLGDPGCSRRFGFDPALAGGFALPCAGPRLTPLPLDPDLPARSGWIEYAPAFGQEATPIHDR